MSAPLAKTTAGDFRPDTIARMRSKRVFEPTLAGRITLTFLFLGFWGAWAVRSNQVFFVACAIAATVLASALLTRLAAGCLSVQRDLPSRVFAGVEFDVALRVKNRSRWRPALDVAFLDTLQVSEQTGEIVPVLPPGGEVSVRYRKRMHRRGIYTLRYTLAATRFPFGIFERRVMLDNPARLVVLPALGGLRRDAYREFRRRDRSAARAPRANEGAQEFHSLREYRSGDNPRLIHWRTSARAGELVRRVMRHESAQDVTILLDTCVVGLDSEMRQRNIEKAISCAATLLVHAQRRNRRAAVHYAGGSAEHRGSRAGLMAALEQLAGIEGGRVGPTALVQEAPLSGATTVVLLSLAGQAEDAKRAAAARGVELRVWDTAHAAFGRYFTRR